MSYKKSKILYINSKCIGFWDLFKIKIHLLFNKDLQFALDMKFVKSIKENFLNFIKEQAESQRLSLLNLNSELMTAIGLRNYDKFVKIYANEDSFYQNKRAIVCRKFKLY